MSQTAPSGDPSRRATPPPDLDALLNSLNAETRAAASARPGSAPGEAPNDLTTRRVQALIRANVHKHRQLGATGETKVRKAADRS